MTSTNENKSSIAGLRAVLQPTTRISNLSLADWLSDLEFPPVWIPLAQQNGVHKLMAVCSNAETYAPLMQQILEQINHRTVVEWQRKAYELMGVEVDNHELHVLEISLFASAPLPPTLGRAIHAQCLHWIGTADAELAEQLHNAEALPMTLVVKPGASRTQLCLRIGLLQPGLLAPLLWGMSQDMGGDIVVTKIPCRLGKSVEIKHSTTFEALTQVPSQKMIQLELMSPTSFKQSQTIQPFPLPELVFSSLLRRWNTFAPENLKFPAIEWQGRTAAYELKTIALKMKSDLELGAKGWVRYEFPNQEQAQIATILAHFAAFAGVGRKTGMGMGQARIIVP